MKYTQIRIPKMSGRYKLYIYRSTSAEDINTISKIMNLEPIIIIDEKEINEIVNGNKYGAVSVNIGGQQYFELATEINGTLFTSLATIISEDETEYYEVIDKIPTTAQDGISYNGPVPNIVPCVEYETSIKIEPVNRYTYVNVLNLNPLPIKYNGTMLYYSVIGVDEENNLITHLSKVNGILVECPYVEVGMRHIYSCDDYDEEKENTWDFVGAASWHEDIAIGNVNDAYTLKKYGNPFVSTVPIFDSKDITYSLKPVIGRNFMVLEIPNPWRDNNKKYNFKKLKSYKIQNVVNEYYSYFSEPTYQSLLPVSLEKMVILKAQDPENPEEIIPLKDGVKDNIETFEVIRHNGIYYNTKDHKKLGLNKWNIPLGESTAVFSEASSQEQIKFQIEALPNHVYTYTIYLLDVYGNCSEPAHIIINT